MLGRGTAVVEDLQTYKTAGFLCSTLLTGAVPDQEGSYEEHPCLIPKGAGDDVPPGSHPLPDETPASDPRLIPCRLEALASFHSPSRRGWLDKEMISGCGGQRS